MSLLKIQTNANVSSEQIKVAVKALSEGVATMLGKPERYVMVSFEQNSNMLFAGTDQTLVYLELKSIGLAEDKTTEYSSILCQMASQHLDVATDRIYIEFSNAQRHLWGWNEATF